MPPIVCTFDIARTPDDVFRYATDPTHFAEWQHDVVDVRAAGPGPLGIGSRFTTTRRIGGVDRTITQEITQLSFPTRWAARGVEGPIRPNATITIEPVDDGERSRVTITLDFDGHGVGVPLLPLVRRQTRKGAPRSYQNLKNLLEGGSSATTS
jgi:uncharacterized protein YndB with AHSA1/START domain